MNRAMIARLAVAAALLAVASCGNEDGSPEAFRDARDLWEAKAPPSYGFTLAWHGQDGDHETHVTVENRRVSSPAPGPSPGYYGSDVGTIDQMFEALERDMRTADMVDVEYDETWGFPKRVQVDVHRSGQDDEFGYGVTDFTTSAE